MERVKMYSEYHRRLRTSDRIGKRIDSDYGKGKRRKGLNTEAISRVM